MHGVSDSSSRPGALAPLDGAKGYAFGLVFELRVGALANCELGTAVHGTLDADQRCNKGDVFILIDTSPSSVIARYLHDIRASAPRDEKTRCWFREIGRAAAGRGAFVTAHQFSKQLGTRSAS